MANTNLFYFQGQNDEKSVPYKIISDNNFFLHFSTLNNSLAIKNDKISHFESFNHVSHLDLRETRQSGLEVYKMILDIGPHQYHWMTSI